MNRRELLKASVFLPAIPSAASASTRGIEQQATLHVTFLYHCAFVGFDADRRTDVILSPGSAHAPHLRGAPAHLAILRVPRACVQNDGELPGTDDQGDRIWRLEGYDLSVAVAPEALVRTTRAWDVALDGGMSATLGAPNTWTIANLDGIAGKRAIDKACLAADPPAFLQHGARVRLSGGHVGCGLPSTQGLREIVWDLGNQRPIGLSDRADYMKTVGETVSIEFRRFGETARRRVTLKGDRRGVIRAFVSNDPLTTEGNCPTLPHFSLYYLLATPAGQVKDLPIPAVHSRASLQTQGSSVCCPCSGGTPPSWP